MSLKPLGRFDEDGEEVVGWVWRKKFYPAAEAKMKSGNVYFAVSDDYQNGTRGKWMAWRAPLEVDEAIGEPLFPAGSQPLTDSEERAVQKAYEKRNPWLFRNVQKNTSKRLDTNTSVCYTHNTRKTKGEYNERASIHKRMGQREQGRDVLRARALQREHEPKGQPKEILRTTQGLPDGSSHRN